MATLKGLTVWRIAHGLGCAEPTFSSACSTVSGCHVEQLCFQQADRQRVCLTSLSSFQAHLCERAETQPAPRLGAQSWVMGCCLLTRRFQPSYWGILLRSCWQRLRKRWWGAPPRQRSWKDWAHPRPDGGGQAWLVRYGVHMCSANVSSEPALPPIATGHFEEPLAPQSLAC